MCNVTLVVNAELERCKHLVILLNQLSIVERQVTLSFGHLVDVCIQLRCEVLKNMGELSDSFVEQGSICNCQTLWCLDM